jgi:hypothetical protein
MIRQSLQERIIRASMVAQYRLDERIRFLQWQEKVLIPRLNDFLARATLPETPTDLSIEVQFDDVTEKPKRARKSRKSS